MRITAFALLAIAALKVRTCTHLLRRPWWGRRAPGVEWRGTLMTSTPSSGRNLPSRATSFELGNAVIIILNTFQVQENLLGGGSTYVQHEVDRLDAVLLHVWVGWLKTPNQTLHPVVLVDHHFAAVVVRQRRKCKSREFVSHSIFCKAKSHFKFELTRGYCHLAFGRQQSYGCFNEIFLLPQGFSGISWK